jgi:hypothetical protein
MRHLTLVLLLLSACGVDGASAGDPRISSSFTTEPPAPSASTAESYSGTRETFYLHGIMSVRAEPDDSAPLVQVLSPGDPVVLGPKDVSGWAPVIDEVGARIGYLYRASDDVRSYAPGKERDGAAAPRAMSSSASREYHRGPRGGCYTYTASGNKRYVDRSLCD